jgi:plastocyanin
MSMEGAQGSSASVVMDQKGCMYVPHVVAAQVGQPVDFHNDDVTMHNVHAVPAVAGNAPVDISQGPKGAPQVRTFKQPEAMMPVRCNNHPWMDAFINISATPFFAVTGPDGKFALKGMPAGEYVLGAVQEKMGEQEVKVTVRAKEQATADFTFAMK